jgi:hypothetical protein
MISILSKNQRRRQLKSNISTNECARTVVGYITDPCAVSRVQRAVAVVTSKHSATSCPGCW